jgi:hypothetical protein
MKTKWFTFLANWPILPIRRLRIKHYNNRKKNKVRSLFNIKPIVVVPLVKGAGPKKGFLEGMKEGNYPYLYSKRFILLEIFKYFSLFI